MNYSVLMSVYFKENAQYFLESVQSMLNQTVKPDEIVLVCDGALTEELDSVIGSLQEENKNLFKIIRLEKNGGLGKALQIGVQSCSNEIVARMDTDDIALENRMEKQLAFLEQNPDICAVGGQIQEFNTKLENKVGYRCVPLTPEDVRKTVSYRNPMNHMTVTFRKQSILDVGNYQHFDKFEDYYLWARLLENGYKLANIDSVCVYARVNDAMYKRRAGVEYFKQTLKLEKYLLNSGLANKYQYYRNICIRLFGTVLIPNRIRSHLYNKMMRKTEV
ncbi:glycosyltransferase [Floccifex sp.]|uniref:glycosyltransferase n=1 Tax=Floccifex sp. TaxID=2815810 RepID=UPI002A75E776|nr:glycosyltransferase [Floccifex sp.]MDD7282118.1 glycosyltransferase [Erysipelotrichaceae bacterium]MDY2957447.1 glycosyltransferase [Floccifex sp.]